MHQETIGLDFCLFHTKNQPRLTSATKISTDVYTDDLPASGHQHISFGEVLRAREAFELQKTVEQQQRIAKAKLDDEIFSAYTENEQWLEYQEAYDFALFENDRRKRVQRELDSKAPKWTKGAWYQGLDNDKVVKPEPINLDAVCPVPTSLPTPSYLKRTTSTRDIKKAHSISGYIKRKMLKAKQVMTNTTINVAEQVSSALNDTIDKQEKAMAGNRFKMLLDQCPDVPECDPDCEMQVEDCGKDNLLPVHKRSRNACNVKAHELHGVPEDKSKEFDVLPEASRARARAMRDKKSRRAYTSLTYYLKCKHFMHSKDPHFIRTLVQDARAWMLRNKFLMETYGEYAILTTSVMAAFFVDQEELNFRSQMKNRKQWQLLDKHNRACAGDLGHRLWKVEPRLNTLRHALQARVRFPASSTLSA